MISASFSRVGSAHCDNVYFYRSLSVTGQRTNSGDYLKLNPAYRIR